jgi:predicted dithiol-disulfide oxidoreductase (DUF899 family)
MTITQSDNYRAKREELRVAELDLMRRKEEVAALRRSLPADTVIDDHELVSVDGDVCALPNM